MRRTPRTSLTASGVFVGILMVVVTVVMPVVIVCVVVCILIGPPFGPILNVDSVILLRFVVRPLTPDDVIDLD